MKKAGIVVSFVAVIALLISASVTFAFFVNRGADTVLEFGSEAPESSVNVTADQTIGALLPAISSSDNTFEPVSDSARQAARIAVKFGSNESGAPPVVKLRVQIAQVSVSGISHPANSLDDDLEFAFAIIGETGNAQTNRENLEKLELPQQWAGVKQTTEVTAQKDDSGNALTGILVVFIRFRAHVTHELVDPRLNGIKPQLQLEAEAIAEQADA